MKTKWQVLWWNDNLDKQVKTGFHSHEEAVTFLYKLKSQNVTCSLKLRGTK